MSFSLRVAGEKSLSVYIELIKPRIILLLLLVAVASYVASSGSDVSLSVLSALLVTGALSSAGSSALNHYLDRDVDGLMARTKHRPLPTGRLRPPEKALAFGIGLVAGGVALSLLLINALTALFILLGALIYVVVYTLLLKRRSAWNIVIGGLAGSCPALAGSAAAVNAISPPAVFIALLVFLWTPGHFWALSLRNRKDYERARIPMLPAVVREDTAAKTIVASTLILPIYVVLFYVLDVVTLSTLLPALVAGLVLLYLSARILRDSRAAWPSFKFSGVFLMVTLLAVAFDVSLL